jgi:hypothetical protein
MKPTLKIESAKMRAALRDYSKHSKRDLAELINQKAYSILIKTAAQNRVSDRGKIITELGQQATAIRAQKVKFTKRSGVKRGKLVTERIYPEALYAIVRWKARKAGKIIPQSEMESEAKRELGRRLSAVNFMKAGWFVALAPVARAIGKALRGGNLRRAKKAFGGATPATFKGNATAATFFNTSFNKPANTTDPKPTRWAEDALALAMQQETANMRQRIADKLAARARRMGSR